MKQSRILLVLTSFVLFTTVVFSFQNCSNVRFSEAASIFGPEPMCMTLNPQTNRSEPCSATSYIKVSVANSNTVAVSAGTSYNILVEKSSDITLQTSRLEIMSGTCGAKTSWELPISPWKVSGNNIGIGINSWAYSLAEHTQMKNCQWLLTVVGELPNKRTVESKLVINPIEPVIAGACGVAVDSCSVGPFEDVSDLPTQNIWKCKGSNGGLDATCVITKAPPAVNGICGSAVNTCTSGSFLDKQDTGTFNWNCNGANGGADVSCTAPIPIVRINGSCGGAVNSCTSGMLLDKPDTTTYNWACNSPNGGSDASCSAPIPPAAVNGACGGGNNLCASGSSVDVADLPSEYKWTCTGSNGGATTQCSLPIPPPVVNGVCGSSNNACTVGTSVDIGDLPTEYKWTCTGSNGGASPTCSAPRPVAGQCGASPQTCNVGTSSGYVASGYSFNWTCQGVNGGADTTCAQERFCYSNEPVPDNQCVKGRIYHQQHVNGVVTQGSWPFSVSDGQAYCFEPAFSNFYTQGVDAAYMQCEIVYGTGCFITNRIPCD